MRLFAPKSLLVAVLAGTVFLGACHKKVAKAPPPPPPAPPAPTVAFTATPGTIELGQPTELSWKTDNATEITLEGIGTVSASGTRKVTPHASTTYQLVAKGPGGTREAAARVTVTEPQKPIVAQVSERDLFAQHVRDVFFDYDKYNVRADQQAIAEADAKFLSQYPNIKMVISGHCDERGSEEYNLALGDNRAASMKDALVRLGISTDRIKIISYGKEKPFCTESTDQCFQQNRRAHFVYQD